MRKLFEEYGAVAISLAVALIFMIILGPVGDLLGETLKGFVEGFVAPLK